MGEWYTDQLTEDELRGENINLRKMVALLYSPHLYTDDGEFSCGADVPSIDFKRMSVGEIKRCMNTRSRRQIERLSPADLASILNQSR